MRFGWDWKVYGRTLWRVCAFMCGFGRVHMGTHACAHTDTCTQRKQREGKRAVGTALRTESYTVLLFSTWVMHAEYEGLACSVQ